MNCPTCQHQDSEVIDSRQRNDMRYRRHKCCKCDYRFATYELTAERLGEIEQGGSTVVHRKLKNAIRLLEAALKASQFAVFRMSESADVGTSKGEQ